MSLQRFIPRSLVIMLATLVLMVVPFLFLATPIANWWSRVPAESHDLSWLALLLVVLLAADIALPVPSSVVGTYAGARYGVGLATLLIWVGLTLGAIVGYGVGRRGGRWKALQLGEPAEAERMRIWQEKWGAIVIVIVRGLPLLAEASVVLAGVNGLAWKHFFPAVALSNLGLAIAYAGLGHWADQHAWLTTALAIGAGLPLLLAAATRWFLNRYINNSRS